MSGDSLRDRIETLVEACVEEEGFDLVEARMRLGGPRRVLTLFIDCPGAPITHGDCVRVSKRVEDALDAASLIDGRYTLEVSSPGLDRPLRGEGDFVRFRGQRARVATRRPVDGTNVFAGRLVEVQGGALLIELDSGRTVELPLELISTARLDVVI